ncbi:hypothetical protein KAJ27_18585, partial [bacterium]|nr:hypothetical protein [bacterium]
MKKILLKVILGTITTLLTFETFAQTNFEIICKNKITETDKQVITGIEEWLFLRNELSHISKGAFYGKYAAKTSECPQSDRQDPITAIVDFNNQLNAQGITLYFMPVPPKALIYADKVDKTVNAGNLYIHYNSFYEELRR